MSGTEQAAAIAALRRQRGSTCTLRRLVANSAPIDVTVIATVKQYLPQEIAGAIVQGDRWAKISDDDIVAASWPGPPRKGDQIILDGRTFTAQGVNTVTMLGTVLSHTLQIRGGS